MKAKFEPVQYHIGQLRGEHRSHEGRDYQAVDFVLQIDPFAGISESIPPGQAVGEFVGDRGGDFC